VDRGSHFEGAPDVVVEIRSPRDETDEKLAFYARAGCREVWVIDQDTRACSLFQASQGALSICEPAADGWLRSELGIELRCDGGELVVRLTGAPGSTARLP